MSFTRRHETCGRGQASILLNIYGSTTWTLTKRLEKKLNSNYTRMLRAIMNKSWWQHPTKHQLYGHLPPIMKTIQVRQTRHEGHCRRSRDELISDVLLWTPAYGRAKAGRPARTYIQQLCEDTGCSPEDLPEAVNDREKWQERGSGIFALAARHDDDEYVFTYYYYIIALSQILSTFQIILHLVCHKAMKWDSNNQHCYNIMNIYMRCIKGLFVYRELYSNTYFI